MNTTTTYQVVVVKRDGSRVATAHTFKSLRSARSYAYTLDELSRKSLNAPRYVTVQEIR